MSLPSSNPVCPAASAAAAPPDDPPTPRSRSHGLLVRPYTSLNVSRSEAYRGRLVFPKITAPAARNRATASASRDRHVVAQLGRTRRRREALGLERVLDGHRQAVERTPGLAPGPGRVGLGGPGPGPLDVERHHGVDRRAVALDAGEEARRAARRSTRRPRRGAPPARWRNDGGRRSRCGLQRCRGRTGRGAEIRRQRRARRSSLPVSPCGSSSTNVTLDGHLYRARCRPAWSMRASSSTWHPSRTTT